MAKERAKTASPKKVVISPEKSDRKRRLKQRNYRSLRLSKRIKHPIRLPSVWQLTKKTATILWSQKKLFAGICLVYGLLNVLVLLGHQVNVTSLKDSLQTSLGGGKVTVGFATFGVLVGSNNSSAGGAASLYQFVITVIASLALIWALRETMAGITVRIRDGYYRGMYPLVPFFLVLLVIALQLLPFVGGAAIYSTVITQGIAVLPIEKLIWAVLFGLTALLSIYMIASSIFALYIVTLPDMTPLKALRSARELVRHRRWTVIRKLILLPIILLLVSAVILLPIIFFAAPLAQAVFFALSALSLAALHGYIYNLYRELLRE